MQTMKRSLSVLLVLCMLAALLSGCAGDLPDLPPLPGTENPQESEPTPLPEEIEVAVTAEPVVVPDALELNILLPTANPRGEELAYYFSGAEEFDCSFAYPSYCSVWVEKGAIRLSPSWFFARMFFTGVRRDAENAPAELIDLLEVGKWGTHPGEGTAGTGWSSLSALTLKYDTWRDWVAWETPERYYLLYGACFDGREGALGTVFDIVAESFRTGEEMLVSAPESGTLLRLSGTLSLFYDGTAFVGGTSPQIELRLRACENGGEPRELSVSGYTAGGESYPFEAVLSLSGGEEQIWTLSLPLLSGDGTPYGSLGFWISARADANGTLFELPVKIEWNT